jgi:hypothetical protein
MNLEIHAAMIMAVIVTSLGALITVFKAIRSIRKSRDVIYYRMRSRLAARGWWMLVFAAGLVLLAILVAIFTEPIAYVYFTPSVTMTLSPTISLTPTITLTPSRTPTFTITFTPVHSYTPTQTGTPFLPDAIESQFTGVVTPDPEAVFSPLKFSQSVENFQPVDPQTTFENPMQQVFVTYSYDKMMDGVQWTLIWYREENMLKYETSPWEGGTGGIGKYELSLPATEWLPGTYQVVFFLGSVWKTAGIFHVSGLPPSPTPTTYPTLTPTSTWTPVPTWTPHPSDTRWPSMTPPK